MFIDELIAEAPRNDRGSKAGAAQILPRTPPTFFMTCNLC
jgi:hypothetical protein